MAGDAKEMSSYGRFDGWEADLHPHPQRRLVERRRAEIARNATATLQAVREGRARYGSVEDLKRDLLAEP